jgi:acyl-coenzyme A thioesterase PaaI-like protein
MERIITAKNLYAKLVGNVIMLLELPHTAGCVACGPANPRGLHLHLLVDSETGIVQTRFSPAAHHIGFENVTHGGIIATVFDEAMVWASTWAIKRFCLCGEMSVRFRRRAPLDQELLFTARVELVRKKLITTSAEVADQSGEVLATSSGKYVPLPQDANEQMLKTLLADPGTSHAADLLRAG